MKIGIDIDGVLANFSRGVIEESHKFGLHEKFPECWTHSTHWYFQITEEDGGLEGAKERFNIVMKDNWLNPEFWLGLKPMPNSMPLPFTPDCYVTARSISSDVTRKWLARYYFPEAPVISVERAEEKLEHILELGLDIFIDDYYPTVRTLRENGVNAVLYEAPYQRGHYEECKDLPTIKYLTQVVPYLETVNPTVRSAAWD